MSRKIESLVILIGLTLLFLISGSDATAQTQVPASGKILAAAYAKATREKKNVIILFHASWCGWCRKMDSALNDQACKAFFENNYVITHLTVDESKDKKFLENKGADLIRKKYHGEKAGLPFWIIMDKNGKLLGDSFIRKEGQSENTAGENIGCPAAENEVEAFTRLLKKTSRLTDEQLAVIADRFKKNT